MVYPMRTLAVSLLLLLGFAIQTQPASAGGRGGMGVGMGIGGYYPGICGATGTVTAYCPTYNKPYHSESDRPVPPYRYQSPSEDCEKTGWGAVMCPSYGAKEPYGRKIEEEAQKPEYQPKPLDDCMKTGWGITECPNYNRKTDD